MIIVELRGGLGNQMFQYALGRQLAELHKTELKLDPGFLKNNSVTIPRPYALNIFKLKENFASPQEIIAFKKDRYTLLAKLKRRLFPYRYSYVTEVKKIFDSNILKLPNNIYLEGYWQSEKYFTAIKEIIRKEFVFKNNFEPKDKNLISIHFRLTDLSSIACSLDYYYKATAMIAQKVKQPKFLIFSDDLNWAKQNFKINYPVSYAEGKNSSVDFQTMSKCTHNIIANSTFSWWAAWLNKNPEKIVIAPRALAKNNKDIFPEGWLIL